MLINTQISCPLCPGIVIADTRFGIFTCQKCFIAYRNNKTMNSLLGKYPTKIVKISEDSDENSKTSKISL